MNAVLCALPGSERFAAKLRAALGADELRLEVRRFPDGESYVRFEDDLARRQVTIVCSLDRPDDKIPALLFAAGTARELGAASVGLVAPYLCYMRQDGRFRPGEAITSELFATQLDAVFDWLATVDAHLHRRSSLRKIFRMPAIEATAAQPVADWIRANVEQPLIVGPDRESERWAAAIGALVGAPHVAFNKVREGDRAVRVQAPSLDAWRGRQPVLVDDIISTARTMAAAARALLAQGFAAPHCVAVHGIFAGDALAVLLEAGAARIVSCNTVEHETNGIDVSGPLAARLREQMQVFQEIA